jgi:hypothetical protein
VKNFKKFLPNIYNRNHKIISLIAKTLLYRVIADGLLPVMTGGKE